MKEITKIVSGVVLTALVSSCGIYTQYKRPEVNTENLYRVEETQSDSVSIADLSWDELFTDTDLQSLIQEGLQSNTDLNIARLKVKEAQATLMSSKLAYLPSLQLSPEGTLSSFDGAKPSKTYNLGTSASWEIDVFGKLTNAKRKSRAALEESDAYRLAVQTQVVATVAANYYSLLMLDEQVDITKATIKAGRNMSIASGC